MRTTKRQARYSAISMQSQARFSTVSKRTTKRHARYSAISTQSQQLFVIDDPHQIFNLSRWLVFQCRMDPLMKLHNRQGHMETKVQLDSHR